MSKKFRALKDVTHETAGRKSVGNSSINFTPVRKLSKIRDFKRSFEKLSFPLGESPVKSENQVYTQSFARIAKFKNKIYSNQSMPFNIGLVFVFITYYSLDTPILSS